MVVFLGVCVYTLTCLSVNEKKPLLYLSRNFIHVILSQTEFTLTFCQFCIFTISCASKNENSESAESFQESHLVY